ncbi:MAG: hypothetical protein HC916_19820 [Coleofasciculaceae cyanobacterium SM2_1_6]|nr:hypothetical protein [Coleofasciculaceae cyanobacterium SM2_1_6]
MVIRAYRSILADLQAWGYEVRIAWWGQGFSKDNPDIDELATGAEITYITTGEFLALAGDVETYAPSDRLQHWEHSFSTHKFVHDSSGTGTFKSHDAGRTDYEKSIYVTNDRRNVAVPTLETWADLESRHGGLTIDGQGKTRRAKPGDTIMTAANCSRVSAHNQARSMGIDGEQICLTCPLLNACRNSQGDGYGFRFERKEALIHSRFKAHPASLPDPEDFDYSEFRLIIDEVGTMPFTEQITADRDAITNLIVDLGDRGSSTYRVAQTN